VCREQRTRTAPDNVGCDLKDAPWSDDNSRDTVDTRVKRLPGSPSAKGGAAPRPSSPISFCIFARSPFSASISGTKNGVRNRFRSGPWFKTVSETVAGTARRLLRTRAPDRSLNHDGIAERRAFCTPVKGRSRHLFGPRSTGDRDALRKRKGGLSFRRVVMLCGRQKSDNP
jgi:hypothetical protein